VGVYWGNQEREKRKFKVFSDEVVWVNAKGEIVKRAIHQFKYFTEQLGGGIGLDMAEIPGGSFLMGTEDAEITRLNEKYGGGYANDERPQHQVNISSFFMGKSPVTQAQWRAVASRTDLKVERDLKLDPSGFKGDDRPVEQVSWYDAVEFCKRLSKLSGKDYRLPSEAEWEYACRANTPRLVGEGPGVRSSNTPRLVGEGPGVRSYPFYFGETITDALANYNANYTYAEEPKGKYREETTPVGQFPPNAFGLYDMHGNVWEWCADDWHNNYEGAPTDGRAWLDNDNHSQKNNDNEDSTSVLRGGSWYDVPDDCRSACRVNYNRRVNLNFNIGFRVVSAVGRTP
jgi:formylglycine-generating enzyme required for sulfatase activity